MRVRKASGLQMEGVSIVLQVQGVSMVLQVQGVPMHACSEGHVIGQWSTNQGLRRFSLAPSGRLVTPCRYWKQKVSLSLSDGGRWRGWWGVIRLSGEALDLPSSSHLPDKALIQHTLPDKALMQHTLPLLNTAHSPSSVPPSPSRPRSSNGVCVCVCVCVCVWCSCGILL